MNSKAQQLFSRIERIENRLNKCNLGKVSSLNGYKLGGVTPLRGYTLDEIDEIINGSDPKAMIDIRDWLVDEVNRANNVYGQDKYMIMNNRGSLNLDTEAADILNTYKGKLVNYIMAILDPEYNYNTGVMVKQPSLMNPPSVSIPIKTLTTIPSEGYSAICLSWNPSMFCTTSMLNKIQIGKDINDKNDPIYANKVCSVLYSLGEVENGFLKTPPSSWNATVRGIPDNLPEVGVAKARLVSSKIKISFRGPILNQGGTIMASATYQGPPGIICNSDDDNKLKTNLEQRDATWSDLFKVSLGDTFDEKAMSPFEEKVISNGIWAKNVNITKDANGISAIFIPTDPMDEIFCKPGTFYGEPVNSQAECGGKNATSCLSTDAGAKLNYLFNIQGIPGDNTNPIIVETYTTWEVIPTSQSASALRNSSSYLGSKYAAIIKEAISRYMDNTTGIQPSTPNQNLNGISEGIMSVLRTTGALLPGIASTIEAFKKK